MLTSITEFACGGAQDKKEKSGMDLGSMVTGNQVNVRVINLKQPDINFENEVAAECLVKRIHYLKEIEIQNVSKWDSAKAKDFVSNKMT